LRIASFSHKSHPSSWKKEQAQPKSNMAKQETHNSCDGKECEWEVETGTGNKRGI